MDKTSIFTSPITWVIGSAASAAYLLYWYGTSTFSYFSDQGIAGPKPIPYIGNLWGLWRRNLLKYDKELARKYGKTFGYYDGTVPNLFTTDINLIKSIFVKDFDHFVNRRDFNVSAKVIRKMVSLMQDQEWRNVRSSITPAFTAEKIKRMSVMIKHCADRLVEKFQEIAETQGKMNAKEHFGAFTMDVIARCAFGMTIDNLGEENDPFLAKARLVFNPPINKSPLIILPFMFPKLIAPFGERLFVMGTFDFFINMLDDLVKQRANTSTEIYHDFVEVATESIMEYTRQEGSNNVPKWNMEEVNEIVTAQCVLFLLAGYDTIATTLTNTAFLLARNPDVQEKLYQQLTRKLKKYGEVSHDTVADFPYLDHIIKEVLRMYPPFPRVERICNKDINYDGVRIKKGTVVTVPAYALHYDEEHYPEPNRFNPDRWNPESPIKPNQYAYLPFGMGPRNCVGMRFAMEEIKIALCTIVKNLRFFPVAETPEEMEFEDGFLTVAQPIHATVGIEAR